MPQVSIILPTFNRGDTIDRAITSVIEQSFEDWELIVVDDGSTDGTYDIVKDVDPRVQIIRQANVGCYAARNRGLKISRGEFLTFLDSDDEWLEHFLELTVGYLKSHRDDNFVMTSFLEYMGNGQSIEHDKHEIQFKFPTMARLVGSTLLDLPDGQTDPYLRVFDSKELLSASDLKIAIELGYPLAALYRGYIFEYLRFGHLGWLPTTVLTRSAMENIGLFPENYRTAADYLFLGNLYKNYCANMISLPSAIKHETLADGKELAEAHLATGMNEYRYAVKRIPLFDALFDASRDTELKRIRGLYCYYAGQVALKQNMREKAMMHFREAIDSFSGLTRARILLGLCLLLVSDRIAGAVYRVFRYTIHQHKRVVSRISKFATKNRGPGEILNRQRKL
jgi:glycosyltransferase involved in cell wall biosynthesis